MLNLALKHTALSIAYRHRSVGDNFWVCVMYAVNPLMYCMAYLGFQKKMKQNSRFYYVRFISQVAALVSVDVRNLCFKFWLQTGLNDYSVVIGLGMYSVCMFSDEPRTRSMLPARCYCRMSWDPSLLDLIPYVSDIYWLLANLRQSRRCQTVASPFPLLSECYEWC